MLTAKTIMVAIRVCFNEQIYEFKGELFRQVLGGAISMRLTGEVARVIMDRWAEKI